MGPDYIPESIKATCFCSGGGRETVLSGGEMDGGGSRSFDGERRKHERISSRFVTQWPFGTEITNVKKAKQSAGC